MGKNQVIREETLHDAKKIIFIMHLAIGDYTYAQTFFEAFSKQYPKLQIDLFIDERRKTSDASKWPSLKNNALFDWVKAAPFFTKIYCENYSPELFSASVKKAQTEAYDLVVSFTTRSPLYYGLLAQKIAGSSGKVYQVNFETKWYQFKEKKLKQQLTGLIDRVPAQRDANYHITDRYNHWFKQLGINLSKTEQIPYIEVPLEWDSWATQELERLHATNKKKVFLNAFSKNRKRTWSIAYVIELIQRMKALAQWQDAVFIVNSTPDVMDKTQTELDEAQLTQVHLFSATDSFFQLPAIMKHMDLVISVDTAIVHIAGAVNVPVITMIRQKTPEWRPMDSNKSLLIYNTKRHHYLSHIKPERVVRELERFDGYFN